MKMQKSATMVSVTIDGRKVTVPEGTMVIDAAEKARKIIPRFCYHERLKPIAACRLCLVEIEGLRGLQASCATPVKADMIVRTETNAAMDSHKEVLDQVLRYHPLDCPKCEAAGCCELEDYTYEFGPHRVSFYEPPGLSGKDYHEERWSPFITFDKYKCVECFRCIRVCDEIHDCGALTGDGRGAKLVISTFANGPLHCDFCASCVSVCPTGAISQHPGRFWKKDWEYDKRASVCTHCGHGCTRILSTFEDKIGKVEDKTEAGINKGNLCAKGRFGFDEGESDKRIQAPMVRRAGTLVEATWDEALTEAAARIRSSTVVSGLASGFLAVEDLYNFRKLVLALGGEVFAESRDPFVSKYIYARTGSYNGTTTFDKILDFRSIAVIDLENDDLDYVTMIEIIKAHRAHGAEITAVGEVTERIARYAKNRVASEPASIAGLDNTLFVVAAEHVSCAMLDAVLARVAADPGSELLVLSSQANSRAFGALGIDTLGCDDPILTETLLVGGDVDLTARPASCKNLIVSAVFLDGISAEADVVFPATLSHEKPGTWVNGEGRPQYSAAAIKPGGLAWPDAAIWAHLAEKLGHQALRSPAEISAAVRAEHPELGVIKSVDKLAGAPELSWPASRLTRYPRHLNRILGHSRWISNVRDHLDASKEFSPWPFM